MPTDKQNVEFMWAIVKQLEVKHINWGIVASTNSISNGHAARMRFHRLRQAMEGITTKHRVSTTIDGSSDTVKDKLSSETPNSRKAKDLTLKRKLANISDDDEEPLANYRACMRMKKEPEDSEDEYMDSELGKKRALQMRIEQGNVLVWNKNQDVIPPKKVKMEDVESHGLAFEEKETVNINDEDVVAANDGLMEAEIKEEHFEIIVEV